MNASVTYSRILAIRLVLSLAIGLAISLGVASHAEGQTRYVGFDRNEYPGDAALPALRKHFDFAGYWLTNPPGSHGNSWLGKRDLLLGQGFGFLVLANGKLDKEILAAGIKPDALGRRDAATAIATATHERFPAKTILFLDQEEGGRLLPEQRSYLLAWTEAVAASGFRPGVYTSGQVVHEGSGATITTAQDIRAHVAAGHLHAVSIWVYEDDCPPAPGCTLKPPSLAASGTPNALVWQYAQSPRRHENTAACARTYAADNNCYAGELTHLSVDMNVADSPDPSGGR